MHRAGLPSSRAVGPDDLGSDSGCRCEGWIGKRGFVSRWDYRIGSANILFNSIPKKPCTSQASFQTDFASFHEANGAKLGTGLKKGEINFSAFITMLEMLRKEVIF